MYTGKILIIDDFKTNIIYLTRLLEADGHEICSGDNSESALRMISTIEFDLILLDVVMPETDGFKMCEVIRKSKHNASTPVIFITSENDEHSILRGFELGGQDYVIRPFNNSELRARINTHLELKKNRAQLKHLNEELEKTVSKRTNELKTALSKLKSSYKSLKEAQKELLNLEKVKENFLRIINHEIRTPLNGIIGFQGLMMENLKDKNLLNYLEMMQESVKRLEKFSMDALLITHLKAGMYKLEIGLFNIKYLIEQILEHYISKILIENITVHLEIQDTYIYTDANLFQYTVRNLIENAIYHSPPDHSITIKGKEMPKYSYQLQILDNGKGFPPEILSNKHRLFINEEFTDNRPGLSLFTIGLIMKYLRGKMYLTNCPQGGASAVIKLKSLQVHGQQFQFQKY
jgi:two-component system, sensor histidine kinase and response regulator